MKKNLITVAVLALFATSAFACPPCTVTPVAPTMVNTGSINNTVFSSASVTGVGSSYSYAAGAAGSSSSGAQVLASPNASSRTMELAGTTSAYNNGIAYNISNGVGAAGVASSVGSACASFVNGQASGYNANGVSGVLYGSGSSVSDTNISVIAGKNQGGTADASTFGTFDLVGNVSGNASTSGQPGTTFENGSVSDTKSTWSNVITGSVTYNGKLLTQAGVLGNATTVVNVSGSFTDLAH